VNSTAFERLLRKLGFAAIQRGKKLHHPGKPPTLYFNRKRDGAVFFTAQRKDRHRFAEELWQELPAQQKKDQRATLITLLPMAGMEEAAFRSLIEDILNRRELEEAAEERRIEQRPFLDDAQRQSLIKARHGQGIFRDNLEKLEQRCRVTGLQDRRHLRAGHIKPWCKSDDREKLDGNNGLLFSPHLHHLFDRGHISFSDLGELLVSRHLNPAVLMCWELVMPIYVGPFNPEQCVYMAYHRNSVFERQEGGRRGKRAT
jgi:predicted restriction endonuclease